MKYMDTRAVEMIPIRLLISITIIAAIISLVGLGFNTLHILIAEHQVEQECSALESTLYTMVESGFPRDVDEINAPEGTKRVLEVMLPDSVLYLSLGGDPDPRNNGKRVSNLTEDGAAIFFKVEGGTKHVIWLPKDTMRFREGRFVQDKWIINGDGHSYIIHSSGSTILVFELVKKNNTIYVLIQGNDDI